MSAKRSRAHTVAIYILTCATGIPAGAATIEAASCNSSDVQAAIAQAQVGDVVAVPAGGCSWGSFTIPGGIHVRGEGAGTTSVTVNGTIVVNKHPSRSVEISGFSFSKSGGGNSAKMFRVTGPWQSEPPLIHDNEFTVNNAAIIRYETNGGVIYNNVFRGRVDDSAIQHKIEDDNQSWTTADTLGTNDVSGKRNLYVEDNVFEGMANQATDFDDAARVVFRHNTLNNASFNSHGLATSPVGVRHYEIYDNVFAYPDRSVNQNWHVWLRGGTGVIFDNEFQDINGSQWGNKNELMFSVRAAVDGGVDGCCRNWPCAHQVGQNHDGNSQFLDTLQLWSNSGTLAYELNDGWAKSCGQDMSDFLEAGRDFEFAANARIGYTPYPYPHPLRDTVRPKAPQDLSISEP